MSDTAEIIEATKESFRELVAEGTVLVDVWGPDCKPCLALFPHVEALAEEHAGDLRVVKLEAPKARRLCMELSVMSMPVFILFHDGVEVARLGGPAVSPAQLTRWLAEQREGVS